MDGRATLAKTGPFHEHMVFIPPAMTNPLPSWRAKRGHPWLRIRASGLPRYARNDGFRNFRVTACRSAQASAVGIFLALNEFDFVAVRIRHKRNHCLAPLDRAGLTRDIAT